MSYHNFIGPGYSPGFVEKVKAKVVEESKTCCLPLIIVDRDADHSPHLGCLAILKVPGWADREVWVSGGCDVGYGPGGKVYRNVCTGEPMFLKSGVEVSLVPLTPTELLKKGGQLADRLTNRKVDRQERNELWKILSSLYPYRDTQPVIDLVQRLAKVLKVNIPLDAVLEALHHC